MTSSSKLLEFIHMLTEAKHQFNEAMLDIHRRAKAEANVVQRRRLTITQPASCGWRSNAEGLKRPSIYCGPQRFLTAIPRYGSETDSISPLRR